ncbi:MAG: Uma2 family endonuclease [Blastocatellia bacterium]
MVASRRTIYPEVSRQAFLKNISWGTYQRLLAEKQEQAGIRLYYDNGTLEIKMPSAEHEEPNRTLAHLIELLAEEMNLDLRRLGSTTFSREDLSKGFEPDSCFYIQNAPAIQGRKKLDLKIDPPPDIVIEVDITSDSLAKSPIFAGLGVPEVWRFDNVMVTIHKLEEAGYAKADHSLAFPRLTSEIATQFLEESETMRTPDWSRRVREWIRSQSTSQSHP